MPIWAWGIILPACVGLGLLIGWLIVRKDKKDQVNTTGMDEKTDAALEKTEQSIKVYQDKLKDISEETEAKLKKASQEQVKDFEEMKDAPPAEIAEWLNKLD
jgi:hypothetical protein